MKYAAWGKQKSRCVPENSMSNMPACLGDLCEGSQISAQATASCRNNPREDVLRGGWQMRRKLDAVREANCHAFQGMAYAGVRDGCDSFHGTHLPATTPSQTDAKPTKTLKATY